MEKLMHHFNKYKRPINNSILIEVIHIISNAPFNNSIIEKSHI